MLVNNLIMEKILYILAFVICAISLHGQTFTVNVEYTYNGKKIALNDDFEIFFVIIDSTQKIIIKPEITQNTFKIPDFCGNTRGHIVFKYKKTVIGLGINPFSYTQNMRWEIGFDKKPYDKEYNIGTGNIEKTKAIAYIAFDPMEWGDGVIATISIVDIKRYFKASRELLK
ncbi:MAG: hypothetical protein PWQ43_1716 [Rikenellaceae bacterium]|nr:hypothetical protein [Rikenellaceae bacterium]MDN5356772.1 hypothetical protein [Rikenellaceae bacterium]